MKLFDYLHKCTHCSDWVTTSSSSWCALSSGYVSRGTVAPGVNDFLITLYWSVLSSLAAHCFIGIRLNSGPWREAGDGGVLHLSPVWNLRAAIWFLFSVISWFYVVLFLLLSCPFFFLIFAHAPCSWLFSPQKSLTLYVSWKDWLCIDI